MRKTKIIGTIGPASENEKTLTEMCQAGMNVARLNFSHGTHEEHQRKIDLIKAVREKLHYPLPIMLDTKGPEYRIKTFRNHKELLEEGQLFTFTAADVEGDRSRVSVSYKNLAKELAAGDRILVNNGLLIFEVTELTEEDVVCKVIAGGEISDRKSMNFPNHVFQGEYLSRQDQEDILFGIQNDVDFVAASFVSTKQDMVSLRKFLDENGGENIDIIAKIENRSGVDHIDEICEIADGIMVARGDLGVEIPFVEVPAIQKYLIRKCRLLGKRVITATEMLESMMVSRFRPPVDIIGMTTSEKAWRKLNMSWGVTPVLSEEFHSVDVMFYHALQHAKSIFHLQKGNNVILTGGQTSGQSGNTNTIRLETV